VPTLAELFAHARERGVPRYRTRPGAELERLLADEAGVESAAQAEPAPAGTPSPVASGVRVERDGPLALIVIDELDAPPDGGPRLAARGAAVCDLVERLAVPVVALVSGHAVGGAAEFALAADWRLVAPSAELRFVHAGLGLSPGFGGLGRLARLVGRGSALRILAARATFDGAAALAAGLADEVVPAEGQRARALELAELVAGSDRQAVAAIKQALATGTAQAEREAFLACWPRRQIPPAARG